jgi:hypothetical protein
MWPYLLYGWLIFYLLISVLPLSIGIILILRGRQTDNLRESARSYLIRGCYDLLVVVVVMILYKWDVLDAFWSIMLLGVLSWPEAAYLFLKRNGYLGFKAG